MNSQHPFRAGTVACLVLLFVSLTPGQALTTITSVGPSTLTLAFAGTTLTVSGTGFTNASVVRANGTPLTTFFSSSTTLGADLCPPQSTTAGTYAITVAEGGTVSNAVNITVENPVPSVFSLMPSSVGLGVLAGSGSLTVTVDGGLFATNATIRINGSAIPTTYVDRFTLVGTISASATANPGTLDLRVFNPAPGGGLSAPFAISVVGPQISSLFGPALPIAIAPTSSDLLFVSGANFSTSATVYLDGMPQGTTQIDAGTLRITLPNTLPQLQQRGGLVVTVENPGGVTSNSVATPIGGAGSNQGILRRAPLDPAPGSVYAFRIENGRPSAPLTLVADAANPAPLYPFANATADQVLSVRPVNTGGAPWLPVIDGLGVYGPASGLGFDGNGNFQIGGITLPNPMLGISLTVQAFYPDPTAPGGYRLTWGRRDDL